MTAHYTQINADSVDEKCVEKQFEAHSECYKEPRLCLLLKNAGYNCNCEFVL
jgi:hypothetical protein